MTPGSPPPPDRGAGREPLLDFPALGRRLKAATGGLGGLAAAAAIVEVAGGGAGGAAALRWATAAVAGILLVAAVLVAHQAYHAADAVQRRGERLSGDDVGLTPPRRPREPR